MSRPAGRVRRRRRRTGGEPLRAPAPGTRRTAPRSSIGLVKNEPADQVSWSAGSSTMPLPAAQRQHGLAGLAPAAPGRPAPRRARGPSRRTSPAPTARRRPPARSAPAAPRSGRGRALNGCAGRRTRTRVGQGDVSPRLAVVGDHLGDRGRRPPGRTRPRSGSASRPPSRGCRPGTRCPPGPLQVAARPRPTSSPPRPAPARAAASESAPAPGGDRAGRCRRSPRRRSPGCCRPPISSSGVTGGVGPRTAATTSASVAAVTSRAAGPPAGRWSGAPARAFSVTSTAPTYASPVPTRRGSSRAGHAPGFGAGAGSGAGSDGGRGRSAGAAGARRRAGPRLGGGELRQLRGTASAAARGDGRAPPPPPTARA